MLADPTDIFANAKHGGTQSKSMNVSVNQLNRIGSGPSPFGGIEFFHLFIDFQLIYWIGNGGNRDVGSTFEDFESFDESFGPDIGQFRRRWR